jgi:hypothetical protein
MKRRSPLKPRRHRLRAQRKGKGNAVRLLGEYEYSPLQLSSSEIRIFEISSAIDNDDVHGKLIIAPLENGTKQLRCSVLLLGLLGQDTCHLLRWEPSDGHFELAFSVTQVKEARVLHHLGRCYLHQSVERCGEGRSGPNGGADLQAC